MSKCPDATKVKILSTTEKSAKEKKFVKAESSTKTAAADTGSSVKVATDSTPPADFSRPITKWVPMET